MAPPSAGYRHGSAPSPPACPRRSGRAPSSSALVPTARLPPRSSRPQPRRASLRHGHRPDRPDQSLDAHRRARGVRGVRLERLGRDAPRRRARRAGDRGVRPHARVGDVAVARPGRAARGHRAHRRRLPAVHAPHLPDRPSLHDEDLGGRRVRARGPGARRARRGMRPAVFLDRDGTVIEERGYLGDVSLIELFPYSTAAMRDLRAAGYALVIVTNQAGRGARLLRRGDRALRPRAPRRPASGAGRHRWTGIIYCPHHPDGVVEGYRGTCRCRKPAPGMIDDAVRELGLDVARSWVVGDKWLDVEPRGAVGRARHPRPDGPRGAGGARPARAESSAAAILASLGDAVR